MTEAQWNCQALEERFREKCLSLGLKPGMPVVVAVSGGCDSMAVLLLARRIFQVTAVTIDHGLRPESADEVRQLEKWCQQLGVRLISRKCNLAEGGNIQARARQERYELLLEVCRELSVPFLLTAHHTEDQAETFLLRLKRGSGVWGLSAMAGVAVRGVVKLVRPVLGERKASLQAYLQQAGQPWIEDPSNEQARFDRVQMRHFLASKQAEAIFGEDAVGRLARTAEAQRRAKEALFFYVKRLQHACTERQPEGWLILRRSEFLAPDWPEEIRLRLVAHILRWVGGKIYAPEFAQVAQALDFILSGTPKGLTVGGVKLEHMNEQRVLLCREAGQMQHVVLAGLQTPAVYDGRYLLCRGAVKALCNRYERVSIGPLGAGGWAMIKSALEDSQLLRAQKIPASARVSLPVIRAEGHIKGKIEGKIEDQTQDGIKGQAAALEREERKSFIFVPHLAVVVPYKEGNLGASEKVNLKNAAKWDAHEKTLDDKAINLPLDYVILSEMDRNFECDKE